MVSIRTIRIAVLLGTLALVGGADMSWQGARAAQGGPVPTAAEKAEKRESSLIRLWKDIGKDKNQISTIYGALTVVFLLLQVKILIRQTKIMNKQTLIIDLQSRLTHRPKVNVKMFRPHLESVDINQYNVEFMLVNMGQAPAYVREIGTRVSWGSGPWTYGAKKIHFDDISPPNCVLQSGGNLRR